MVTVKELKAKLTYKEIEIDEIMLDVEELKDDVKLLKQYIEVTKK